MTSILLQVGSVARQNLSGVLLPTTQLWRFSSYRLWLLSPHTSIHIHQNIKSSYQCRFLNERKSIPSALFFSFIPLSYHYCIYIIHWTNTNDLLAHHSQTMIPRIEYRSSHRHTKISTNNRIYYIHNFMQRLLLLLLFVICPTILVLLPSQVMAYHLPIAESSPSAVSDDTSTSGNRMLLQVIEKEVWDSTTNSWKAAPGGRWWMTTTPNDPDNDNQEDDDTDSTIPSTVQKGSDHTAEHTYWQQKNQNLPSLSPSELQPPEGFHFVGDWKIVVPQASRDSKGWEYTFRYLQQPRRRRIWLRTLQQIPSRQQQSTLSHLATDDTKSTALTSTGRRKRHGQHSLPMLVRRIRDDWNFKGYGISLYKSFIFPTSLGIALRLPLSSNFISWDQRPELPSISSSLGLYYPWTIAGFLSASIHVEWIKYTLTRWTRAIWRILVWFAYSVVLQGITIGLSICLYPFLRRLHRLPILPSPPSIPRPRYGSEISERVGVSLSYRWSQSRGFEGRVSYWHSYLPTLLVYQTVWTNLLKRFYYDHQRWRPLDDPRMEWWQKHFAAVGTSLSGPIPSPPHVSFSAVASLSGFYWTTKTMTTSTTTTTIQPSMTSPISSNVSPTTKLSQDGVTILENITSNQQEENELLLSSSSESESESESSPAIGLPSKEERMTARRQSDGPTKQQFKTSTTSSASGIGFKSTTSKKM